MIQASSDVWGQLHCPVLSLCLGFVSYHLFSRCCVSQTNDQWSGRECQNIGHDYLHMTMETPMRLRNTVGKSIESSQYLFFLR
ncbi:hypothetical protein ARMSODRAFT_534918 [Armillaria solidipes]|uniref:Uncharacterized protein n=1 Tax=Armillaria solidipes TaxID=1076256 RepID=A0A2H3AXM7_9AGAR|nr:hypothetical protein ARMSODRAFT_534918 [Armillaria solidipes]